MNQTKEVAIAIITQGRYFLMQLRDDLPDIYYPGQWGFFGGHIDPGETPAIAVHRELIEEIGFAAPEIKFFHTYPSPRVIRHVFHAPLTVPTSQLILTEGQDFRLLGETEIRQGQCYSSKITQIRTLGKPHQRILLDFIEGTISDISQL